MEIARIDWPQVHLALYSRANADQEDRARRCRDAALQAGLAQAVHLDAAALAAAEGGALPAPIRADRAAAFRAAVPRDMARRLAALPAGHVLLVQILEDNESHPIFATDAAMATLLQDLPARGIFGQASCWPNLHHVRADCLIAMEADDDDLRQAAFTLPSPAILPATDEARFLIEDWAALAADPLIACEGPDRLAPSSGLLRRHEGAWAAASVLARLRGVPAFLPRPPDPAHPAEARLLQGGLRLAEAATWHHEGHLELTATPASAATPERLRAQVLEMLATASGHFSDDHVAALIAHHRDADALFFALAEMTPGQQARLRADLCTQLNLAWAETIIEGGCLRPDDLHGALREACLAAITFQQGLRATLTGVMIWNLIGQAARRHFRGVFGPVVSGTGREALTRFVAALDEDQVDAILAITSAEQPEALALRGQVETWIAVGG